VSEHPVDTTLRGLVSGPVPNETKALDRVLRLRKQQMEWISAVVADRDLTAEAKRRRLAKLVEDFRVEKDRLLLEHRRELAEREARLLRKSFGPPKSTEVEAWRQAATAAAGLESEDQAMVAVGIARRGGDEAWLRSLGSVAFQRGWLRVLQAYLEDRPDVAEALTEVEAMKDPNRRFADQVAFSALTLPMVPDRGPAEIESERKENQAPFPTLTGRVVEFGG
jgi:hypothetical protein